MTVSMVSKNNLKNKMEQTAARTPHYGIRKLSVGVASVLISTTLYMGATTAKADTLPSTATDVATTNPETASSSSSTQTNATVDNTAKTTVPTTASSTDTRVSTTSNAQASTTNTTASAISSDKSSANNNSLVTNNVEPTANTTAQAQPKTTDVISDKTNVDNQVGSDAENKATTTDTTSVPTTPKRVVRSLAVAPTTVNDPVDLTKWEYNVDSLGDAHVLSYNGDVTQPIYIPNSYDFIQAGKITAEHKAFITSDNMQKLAGSGTHELYISKNGNGKLIAEDNGWYGTFCGSSTYSGRNAQLSETIGKNLEKLDLTNLDVTNIQNMGNMFSFNSQLTSIGDLSNWDTHNVTDMHGMFTGVSKLTNIGDLSNWNTSKVTNMYTMFSNTSGLTNIGDLSNWDTHNVTDMYGMFNGTSSLTSIGDLSNWDTHNVTDMAFMFSGASKLTDIGDLSSWDTSKVTNMNNMFIKASRLTDIGNLSNWDTHNVTNMYEMFYGASGLTNIGDLSNWDTGKVTNMGYMFVGASKLTDIGDLSNWDTSKVTNMKGMFGGTSKLTDIGDLSNWNTSKVTNMSTMFSSASSLTNIGDLSNWDTSKVTNMKGMFEGTSKLTNIGDLSGWNVDNVVDSENMMKAFGKDSKEPILQNLPGFTKTKNSSSGLPIASTGTGVYDARGVTSSVQGTSANDYGNNHIVLTSDTSLLDHSNISNNVNNRINQITINGNKIALPVFYKDYQDLHDTVQKTIDDYAEKLRSQGKIVKNTPKVADYSTEPTTDWLKYFTNYTIDVVNQTKINYVDTDGTTIHTTVIEGKSGETVSVPNEIPTGYKLVAGLSVPTEITFTADGYPITNLTIEAIHTTVTADNPKTTVDKLPDNPTKNYPEGVSEIDLNKTVTRTINITDPRTQKVTPVVQTVHLTRSADVDEITGEVVYSDWTTSSFDSYNVPEVPGYTATVQSIDEAPVDINSKDQTVDVSYTANPQSIKVNYVDSDNNDSVVKSDTLSGKTDQTVKTDIDIPDGYVVEGNVPSDYTFKAKDNADITIKLKHGTTTVTPDKPKTTGDKLPDNPNKNYPSGVAENDLNKDVTRTIKVTDPTGKVTTTTQTVHLTRTATVDEVTGEVTYSDWSTGSFDSYDVPEIEGYTATQSNVDTAKVTSDTQNSEVNVTYTANPQSIKINYVDDEKGGATVKSDTLNGKTDETVKTGITIPENYSVVGTTPSEYTFKSSGNTDITVHLKHVIDTTSEEKTITRTIKVTDPTGKVTTIPQTAKVTRTVSTDKVTNQKTYGDWTTSSFDSYDVPTIEGYTPTQSKVDEVKVTSDTQNSEVNISYTANTEKEVVNGSWTFKYTDKETGEEIMPATTIHAQFTRTNTPATNTFGDWSYVKDSFSQTGTHVNVQDPTKENDVTDHSDIMDTFKFSVPMPEDPSDKYQQIYGTSDVTFKLYNDNRQAPTLDKTLIIPYKHKIIYKETTVEIPLNYEFQILLPDATHLIVAPTKDHLNGRRLDNVAYTVKKTIEGESPYDKVTGTFDYTKFSIYDRRQLVIPGRSLPQNIDNYYIVKAIGETTESNQYVGLTVQELLTKLQAHNYFALPTWESNLPLTSDDTDLTFVTKEEQGITKAVAYNDLTIHSSVVVFDPRIGIEALAEDDYPFATFYYTITKEETKTVTRTIELQLPMKPTQAIKQTAILTRDQYQATNEPYNKDQWSKYATAWHDSEWNAYTVPTVDGYTASQNEILVTKVTDTTKDQTIRVTYTANPQSIQINYVDDDKGGATVKSETLDGKTDQTVKTGITIPENYTVVGTAPSDYTFKAKDNADITVHLKHVIDTKSEEKTITRTIKVTNPNGGVMTIPQSAKSTRTVSTDKVTGEVTYGDWSKATLDGYDVPLIEGYTASQPSVATTTVDGSSEDNVVEINYTPNKQVISIDYVDNGKVISTQVLTGKTDETVKTNIQSPDKDKYVVIGDNPESYTFKAKDNADIRVEVKHVINDSTESKDVTRTIVVTTPDGKETTQVQKATVSRTVHTDAVTGAKTYGEWSKATLDKYDVPVVDGYTPSLNIVEGLEVDDNNEDSVVKVGYTANPQSIKVNYVDEDNGSSTVKTETLNGKTDQTVKTGIEIPDGYVVEGQVPTDYTFKAKDNADITVKLKHGTTTVTADNPKTTDDKLPDNPSKSYPSGVGQNDLNKDVTRTIKVTDPTGKVTTETQTVHLTRTATVDEVTGNVTYGDWTTGSFDSYDVPSVEGYTASQDKVEETPVTADSTNSEVNISYTANDQSIKINYIDNNGGTTVKFDTLNGKTDQTVKTGITIPDGYVVDGNVPTDYTFKAKDNADITVHLTHNNVTVTADNPKTTDDKLPDNPSKNYPSGVAESDLNKDIIRTINVTTPDGKTSTTIQTVHLTRNATVDEVTRDVSYSDWTTGSFDSYDVPSVEGYTASQDKVDTDTVTSDTQDSEVNITYTANKQVISIDYVDNGKVISTQVLTGKTDETVETNIQSPDKDKYVVVGTNPDTYTFKAKNNEDIRVEVKHVINDSTESKDVTRTIVVTSPDGKETTKVQKATVSRTVHTDAVTGAKTYDEWSKATLDKYNVPTVDGYTPSLNVVEGLEVDGNNEDSVVKVGYTANEQTAKIIYVDGDNGNSTVKTDILSGKTDQTVETGVKVPDGYTVEGSVPDSYTFKAKDNADITVKLKHGTTTVTPDKPKTANDKLPDNPTKSYPSGVAENDLNKDVTRTINVTDPKDKVTTKTQTVHLTRTATVDEATGKVTYGDWSTGAFGNYDVPVIEGYTPNVATISAQTVTDETKPTTITVNYTPNEHTTQLQYVDDKGAVIKTVPLHGVTGETISVPTNLPADWVLTPTTKVPATITMTANGHPKVVATVQHGKVTVTPDKPKTTADPLPDNPNSHYPTGVGEKDLNQTLTRTINLTVPGQKTRTITQTVTVHRSATVDEVTGEVTYSDWSTDEWPAVTVPSVPGYTPNVATISAQTVTDKTKPTTITVNYAPNEHTTQLQYVDDKGEVIKTVQLHGVTGETVSVPQSLPDGWVLTPNTKLPETITMTTNGHPKVVVTVQHGKVNVTPDKPKTTADPLPNNPNKHYPTDVGESDLNKTLTRTINLTVPEQKARTITQTVTVHRSATVDEVTGEVTYSDWSTAEWPEVTVPSVPGYTPTTKTIPAQTVTDKIKNTTVTVNYTADEHTTQLQYVDEQGNVVETLTLQGRTGETVTVPQRLPAGWVLTPNTKLPAKITMTANGHPKVVITVQHGKVTVTPDHPKTTADPLPDNPNNHYPAGVGESDLNKTLTRTINLTVPEQKARTITQTVTVHRSATVDEVTGEVTYNSWSTAEWPEVTVPSVQGYTPSQEKVPAAVASADNGDQTVTIAYHKDSVSNKTEKQTSTVKPETKEPAKPMSAQTTKVEKPASAAKSETAYPTKPETGTLPQTGDAKNAATLLGVINMLFTGLVGWWTKKKHKPQA